VTATSRSLGTNTDSRFSKARRYKVGSRLYTGLSGGNVNGIFGEHSVGNRKEGVLRINSKNSIAGFVAVY